MKSCSLLMVLNDLLNLFALRDLSGARHRFDFLVAWKRLDARTRIRATTNENQNLINELMMNHNGD